MKSRNVVSNGMHRVDGRCRSASRPSQHPKPARHLRLSRGPGPGWARLRGKGLQGWVLSLFYPSHMNVLSQIGSTELSQIGSAMAPIAFTQRCGAWTAGVDPRPGHSDIRTKRQRVPRALAQRQRPRGAAGHQVRAISYRNTSNLST